jgi:mycothiol synthase
VAAEIRRLGPDHLSALASEVARARAAGEFNASSDPEGAYFLDSFRYTPSPAAAAFDADGSMLGFASPEFKLVVVRPDVRRQGVGRALVEAAIEIERERGRPNVLMGTLPDDAVGEAFLRATGFGHHSTVWDLALPADAAVPAPAWPTGIVARPFSRAADLRAWAELHNTAFAHHPTPMQMDLVTLETAPADPAVDDLDTVLAADAATGELVGFCSTFPDRIEGRPGPDAEIWAIGVAPERQGQGIGRQLLRWGVARLRGLGAAEVRLSVNGSNEGALGLYRREGFAPWRTRERWARPVAAG